MKPALRPALRRALAAIPAAVLLSACIGAPMRASSATTLSPTAATGSTRGAGRSDVAAPPVRASVDVTFMQRLLAHHAQALRITELVRTQSTRSDLRILALRTELSQRDEIALMRYWLDNRSAPAPTTTRRDRKAAEAAMQAEAAQVAASPMPGMLSAAQLDSLAKATTPAFDAMFLRYMITHDAGALAMVADHLAAPGAALQPETRRLLSDFDAERRAELHRLRTLLAELEK